MKHGNILALFNADDATTASVEVIVTANASQYKAFGSLFYIATPDITSAENIVTAIEHLNVEFVFYYNNRSIGSRVLGNLGNPDLAEIIKIML